MDENIKNPQETYLGLSNGNDGNIEFDLVTARQKGQEIRYLSISIQGISEGTSEIQNASINVDEETFKRIKAYFTNLEWNS